MKPMPKKRRNRSTIFPSSSSWGDCSIPISSAWAWKMSAVPGSRTWAGIWTGSSRKNGIRDWETGAWADWLPASSIPWQRSSFPATAAVSAISTDSSISASSTISRSNCLTAGWPTDSPGKSRRSIRPSTCALAATPTCALPKTAAWNVSTKNILLSVPCPTMSPS